jgi:hypothetical protein
MEVEKGGAERTHNDGAPCAKVRKQREDGSFENLQIAGGESVRP